MSFGDIAQFVIFGLVGLVVLMLLGWLLAFFISVFFRILGIQITGQGCLSCLSTVLAAAVTGAFGVVGAVIANPQFLATPVVEDAPLPDLVPGASEAAPDPTLIIIAVLVIVFIVLFFVIRRTLGKSVT
jgi:hypothetical protein